jgi:uncharacterized protein YndB with AHSA1/START domain
MPKKPTPKAMPEPGGPVGFSTEIWITAPLPRLWQLVTKGAWLDRYFTSETTGNLDAPGSVRMSWGDIHEDIEVLSAAWEKKTVFRWIAYELKYATRVTITLKSKGSMTNVAVAETGWKRDAAGVSSSLHHAVGWTHFLAQLKAFAQFGVELRG